jgi:hypothetical protein
MSNYSSTRKIILVGNHSIEEVVVVNSCICPFLGQILTIPLVLRDSSNWQILTRGVSIQKLICHYDIPSSTLHTSIGSLSLLNCLSTTFVACLWTCFILCWSLLFRGVRLQHTFKIISNGCTKPLYSLVITMDDLLCTVCLIMLRIWDALATTVSACLLNFSCL